MFQKLLSLPCQNMVFQHLPDFLITIQRFMIFIEPSEFEYFFRHLSLPSISNLGIYPFIKIDRYIFRVLKFFITNQNMIFYT